MLNKTEVRNLKNFFFKLVVCESTNCNHAYMICTRYSFHPGADIPWFKYFHMTSEFDHLVTLTQWHQMTLVGDGVSQTQFVPFLLCHLQHRVAFMVLSLLSHLHADFSWNRKWGFYSSLENIVDTHT